MPLSELRAALRGALVSLIFITPVSAQSWQQTLTGGTTSLHDHFGTSLATHEGELFVGTPRDDTTGTARASGSVTVFAESAGAWSESELLLSPSLAMDGCFGASLSLDGARLLVGAPGEDSLAAPATGAAHLYERTGAGWSLAGSLQAINLDPGDRLGYDVCLDGDLAAVGVPGREHDGWNTGCVILFRETTSGWVEEARLFPPAGSSGARFGHALALEGDTLVVGAPEHSDLALASGAAFVYSRDAQGAWSAGAALVCTNGVELQRFGAAVSINSSAIVVGGPGSYAPFGDSTGPQSSGSNGPPRGVAWVFHSDGEAWVPAQRLRAPAGEVGDLFGQHLCLSADRLSVSAGGRQTAGGDEGATFLFEGSGAGWFLTGEIGDPSPSAGGMFGAAAVHDEEELFISGVFDAGLGDRAGCVQVFLVEGERHQSCFGEQCPCGNDDPLAGCANSTGAGALLFALGSPSLIEDDLVVGASGLPPETPAIVFFSNGASDAFFGDGILCIGGGGLSRMGRLGRVRMASLEGVVSWGPGLFSSTGLSSFAEGIHLQAIYRDRTGSCGAGVNLSNALEFQVLP